jgi:hypothetical protein
MRGFQDVFYITRVQLGLPPSVLNLPAPSANTTRLLLNAGNQSGPTVPVISAPTASTHMNAPYRSISAPATSNTLTFPGLDIPEECAPNGGRPFALPAPRQNGSPSRTRNSTSAERPLVTPLPAPVRTNVGPLVYRTLTISPLDILVSGFSLTPLLTRPALALQRAPGKKDTLTALPATARFHCVPRLKLFPKR